MTAAETEAESAAVTLEDDDGYTERRLAMDEAMVARLQIVRIIISPSAS